MPQPLNLGLRGLVILRSAGDCKTINEQVALALNVGVSVAIFIFVGLSDHTRLHFSVNLEPCLRSYFMMALTTLPSHISALRATESPARLKLAQHRDLIPKPETLRPPTISNCLNFRVSSPHLRALKYWNQTRRNTLKHKPSKAYATAFAFVVAQ